MYWRNEKMRFLKKERASNEIMDMIRSIQIALRGKEE